MEEVDIDEIQGSVISGAEKLHIMTESIMTLGVVDECIQLVLGVSDGLFQIRNRLLESPP
jgi:hypothetical protein